MSKTTVDFSVLQTISEQNVQQLQEVSRLNISYNAVKIPTPPHNFPILVTRVAFDPAGERIAIGAYDGGSYGYVSIWSLKDGEHYFLETTTLPGTVRSLAWHPDGIQLAAGGALGHVNIWDVQTHQQIVTLKGYPGPKNYVKGLAFSADGKLLASGDANAALRIIDAHTYQEIKQLEYYVSSNIAFMSNNRQLGFGIYDWNTNIAHIVIWDIVDGQEKLFNFGDSGMITSVCFSQDNNLIFAHGSDDSVPNDDFMGVRVYDIKSGEIISEYRTSGYPIAMNKSGELHFLQGDADKKEIESTIEVWNWRKKERLVNIHTGSSSTDLALNQQNTLIAMPDNQGNWNTVQQGVVLYGVPIE